MTAVDSNSLITPVWQVSIFRTSSNCLGARGVWSYCWSLGVQSISWFHCRTSTAWHDEDSYAHYPLAVYYLMSIRFSAALDDYVAFISNLFYLLPLSLYPDTILSKVVNVRCGGIGLLRSRARSLWISLWSSSIGKESLVRSPRV